MLPEEMLNGVAYNALPDFARTVLTAMAARYQGYNNGNLSLPVSEAKTLGVSQAWKLYAGLNLLKLADLIVCTRQGLLTKGTKLCSLYAVTWRGIDPSPDGVSYDAGTRVCLIPAHEWVRWLKPPDWTKTILTVKRANQGKVIKRQRPWRPADSVSPTGVTGRSPTGVTVEGKTDHPRVVLETPKADQPVGDASKTLVPGRQHVTNPDPPSGKRCSPRANKAEPTPIAPKPTHVTHVTHFTDQGSPWGNAEMHLLTHPSVSDADLAGYGLSSAKILHLREYTAGVIARRQRRQSSKRNH
jgi:hypothetical protein